MREKILNRTCWQRLDASGGRATDSALPDPYVKPMRNLRLRRDFPDQTISWETRSSDSGLLTPSHCACSQGKQVERQGPALWVTGARKERRTKSRVLPVVAAAEEFSSHTATGWSPNASCQFRSRGTILLTFRSPPAPVGPSWPGPLTPEGRRPPWSESTPSLPSKNPDTSHLTAGPCPRWLPSAPQVHVTPERPGRAAGAKGEHMGSRAD